MEYYNAYIYFDKNIALKKQQQLSEDTKQLWIVEEENKFYRVRKAEKDG